MWNNAYWLTYGDYSYASSWDMTKLYLAPISNATTSVLKKAAAFKLPALATPTCSESYLIL
jgi:peroxiredoxin